GRGREGLAALAPERVAVADLPTPAGARGAADASHRPTPHSCPPDLHGRWDTTPPVVLKSKSLAARPPRCQPIGSCSGRRDQRGQNTSRTDSEHRPTGGGWFAHSPRTARHAGSGSWLRAAPSAEPDVMVRRAHNRPAGPLTRGMNASPDGSGGSPIDRGCAETDWVSGRRTRGTVARSTGWTQRPTPEWFVV